MPNIIGSDVVTLKKILRKKFGEEKEKKFIEWLPTNLRETFTRISTKTWTPVEVQAKIYEAAGQYFFPTKDRQVFRLHKAIAKSTYTGIYKILVLLSSIKFLIKRATVVWSLFYDAGVAFAEHESNNSLRFIVKDFPELPKALREATDAHIYVLIKSSGAKNVVVEREDTNPDYWTWHVRWT